MRVSEIRVKRIRVNQGLGVLRSLWLISVLPKRMSKNDMISDTIGASCVQLVGKHAQVTFLNDVRF